jgi:hypothetical protein
MRFYERYVVSKGRTSVTQPAWVCRCGFEEYVRAGQRKTGSATDQINR